MKFEKNKTYQGRRGRRTYIVKGLEIVEGVSRYTVLETGVRGVQFQTQYWEEQLRARARLKSVPKTPVYLSASQIETYRTCPRKWAYSYIDGEITPSSSSQAFGSEVHSVLEQYLKTGVWGGAPDAVACARQGEHVLPHPNSRLGIEQYFQMEILGGVARLIGYIDLVIPPELIDNILEIDDHKSTKDLKYALTPQQLAKDEQGIIYSVWGMEHFKVDRVRNKWRYYCARPSKAKKADEAGRPRNMGGFRAVTHVQEKAALEPLWADILTTCGEMVALTTDPKIWASDVPCNEFSCNDYGGCPFRGGCKVEHASIGALMDLASKRETPTTGGRDMASFMDIIKAKKAAQQATLDPRLEPTPEPAATVADPTTVLDTVAPHSLDTLAQGVNPPPVEAEELPDVLVEASKPIIPQAWIDRRQKGHKPRVDKEQVWRAEQPAVSPENDALEEAKAQEQKAALAEKVWRAEQPAVSPENDALEEAKAQEQKAALADRAQGRAKALEQKAALADRAQGRAKALEQIRGPGVAKKAPTPLPPPGAFGADYIGPDEVAPSEDRGWLLLVDCTMAKGPNQRTCALPDLLQPVKEALQEKHKVAFWNLLKYREGETLLAAGAAVYLRENKPTGFVCADSSSSEWKACGDVLIALADIVIRG